jgi:hypothetical protein
VCRNVRTVVSPSCPDSRGQQPVSQSIALQWRLGTPGEACKTGKTQHGHDEGVLHKSGGVEACSLGEAGVGLLRLSPSRSSREETYTPLCVRRS